MMAKIDLTTACSLYLSGALLLLFLLGAVRRRGST